MATTPSRVRVIIFKLKAKAIRGTIKENESGVQISVNVKR